MSGVVLEWYFHRHHHSQQDVNESGARALKRSVMWSFGTLCLASLLLTVVQVIRIMVRLMRYALSNKSTVLDMVVEFMVWVEASIEGVNNYIIPFVAYGGVSFRQATAQAMQLLHLPTGVMVGMMMKVVLLMTPYIVAMLSYFTLAQYHSTYYSAVSILMPHFVVRYFVHLVTSVMDSLFVAHVLSLRMQDGAQYCPVVNDIFAKPVALDSVV